MDATGAEIGGVQTGATGALVEHHQLFTLFKAPEWRGQRAHVHRLRGHVQQMVQDATDFRIQHADQAGAARHHGAGQLFDRQTPGMLLVHRRHIIQTIQIGQVLQVGAAFHQLFGAAMQQADMRIGALDHLAVQLQHHAQHTVGRRVLRAEVDVEVADLLFRRAGVVEFSVHQKTSRWVPRDRAASSVCGAFAPGAAVRITSRPRLRPVSRRPAGRISRPPTARGSRTADIPAPA